MGGQGALHPDQITYITNYLTSEPYDGATLKFGSVWFQSWQLKFFQLKCHMNLLNTATWVCLQYFGTVGWVFWPVKNRRPYNLYCVGGDVKPCSVNQNLSLSDSFVDLHLLIHLSHVGYILLYTFCHKFVWKHTLKQHWILKFPLISLVVCSYMNWTMLVDPSLLHIYNRVIWLFIQTTWLLCCLTYCVYWTSQMSFIS